MNGTDIYLYKKEHEFTDPCFGTVNRITENNYTNNNESKNIPCSNLRTQKSFFSSNVQTIQKEKGIIRFFTCPLKYHDSN